MADKKTKRVDGEDLEKSAFAYQGSDELADWKLPIKFSTEEKTKSHIRNAIARWSSTSMPNADEKKKARGRIRGAAEAHGIDIEEGSLARARSAATKPRFRASLSDGTLELLVYEDIGENMWTGGGVTAKAVKQQLDSAGICNRIAVRINSPGGDAFEGVAILNLLKSQKKPVDVFVDGIAASAASIIAMAGTTITMGPSAMMMIHNAWTVCMGDGDDMRKCADTLDRISESVGQAYVDKTGQNADAIKALMDAETWMGAQECVDNGFATAIANDDEEQAMALAKSFKSLAKLKRVPERLKADEEDGDGECECDCGPCQQGDCAGCDCDGCDEEDCEAEACDCAGDGPDADASAKDSNLSQYEARLKLLTQV